MKPTMQNYSCGLHVELVRNWEVGEFSFLGRAHEPRFCDTASSSPIFEVATQAPSTITVLAKENRLKD